MISIRLIFPTVSEEIVIEEFSATVDEEPTKDGNLP